MSSSGRRWTWNRRSGSESNSNRRRHPPPPPGLKGKEIGLFYRDLQREKPKTRTERYINFWIPTLVFKKAEASLQALYNTARRHGIAITKGPKLVIPEQSNEIDPNLIQTDENDQDEDAIKAETADNIPLVDEDEIKMDSNEGSPLKLVKLENNFKKPEPLLDKPSTSATEDFDFGIKQEPVESTMNCLLSLKNSSEFKYGYKDIITGTFLEKLNESVSRGIEITKSNSDIDKLNEQLFKDYMRMITRYKFEDMFEFRRKLPAYEKTDIILETLKTHQVVVISGETGCGKSTQVPQIILDDALNNNRGANVRIMVTQPRRIAASSLAERVAEERAERLGISVGYAVRLDKREARGRGSITFVTTGIMLAELEVNQGLTDVSHVVLDEVHERDTHVDFTMCLLREVLKVRKDLKLILMSATLDADRLTAYFDNCPQLHIEGLAFPVQDIYLEDILMATKYELDEESNKRDSRKKPERLEETKMAHEIRYRAEIGPWLESIKDKLDDNVYRTLLDPSIEVLQPELIVTVVTYICRGPPGAILIFVPGIAEISKLLYLMCHQKAFPESQYEFYPLHSKLPSLEQKKIFERPALGVRKIIIATNIAETSITIDDIVYVIDAGKVKITGFDVESNVSTLTTQWISQANLRQRRGRAGRCQPGICYHLMTSFRASKLELRTLPEVQRSNLLEEVLMVKQLRLGMAEEAVQMLMDVPDVSTVKWAVKHLQKIGALDDRESLSPLGWHLARLPLHPAAGKLLILGALFGVLNRAACVAAVWGFKDPFMMVIGKEGELDKARLEFSLGEPSDHIALSQAIIAWERMGHQKRRQFALKNYLSNSTLLHLIEMKNQLGHNLKQMGFLASGDVKSGWKNRNGENLSLFKAIVAASLYPNVAKVKWQSQGEQNGRRLSRISTHTAEDGPVEVHPSSVMAARAGRAAGRGGVGAWRSRGCWLAYWLKQRSVKLFLLEVTVVFTLPLLFFGELVVSEVAGSPAHCSLTVGSFAVRCLRAHAQLVLHLRALLDQVLAAKVAHAGDCAGAHGQFEEEVLSVVRELITAEDGQVDYYEEDGEPGPSQPPQPSGPSESSQPDPSGSSESGPSRPPEPSGSSEPGPSQPPQPSGPSESSEPEPSGSSESGPSRPPEPSGSSEPGPSRPPEPSGPSRLPEPAGPSRLPEPAGPSWPPQPPEPGPSGGVEWTRERSGGKIWG